MMIQKYSAVQKRVNLSAVFINFDKPNMPESEKYTLLTDKKHLQQVIMNLQSNALKFTKAGGKVTITVIFVPA